LTYPCYLVALRVPYFETNQHRPEHSVYAPLNISSGIPKENSLVLLYTSANQNLAFSRCQSPESPNRVYQSIILKPLYHSSQSQHVNSRPKRPICWSRRGCIFGQATKRRKDPEPANIREQPYPHNMPCGGVYQQNSTTKDEGVFVRGRWGKMGEGKGWITNTTTTRRSHHPNCLLAGFFISR
jgi:hypothetical protein